MKENVLLIGPYIGDWEHEITTFRPYAKWISENVDANKIFISSHFNRQFLYDWIPNKHFIPVYEHLTRNEKQQQNYLHESIDNKDYKFLIKESKQQICKKLNISIRQILHYTISYLESTPHYSWYQKIFTPINIDPIPNDYILYIPSKNVSDNINKKYYNYLNTTYNNVYMIGDSHCYKFDHFINYQIDYYETGYKNLMKYLLGCKLIITPCSQWTMLCNLHNLPVFSWGDCRQYMKNSDYGFNNNNNYILISNDFKRVIKSIDYFKNVREKNNDL